MTELDRTWARSQIDAMADGSLSPEAEQRMRVLLKSDRQLSEELEAAHALRRRLRSLAAAPVPKGLMRNLWNIPAAHRSQQRNAWMPATAVATIAAAVLGIAVLWQDPGPSAEEVAREAALRDFVTVVAYVQRGAMLARNEVNEAVGGGMRDAVAISREAIGRAEVRIDQGDQDNAD